MPNTVRNIECLCHQLMFVVVLTRGNVFELLILAMELLTVSTDGMKKLLRVSQKKSRLVSLNQVRTIV